MAQIQRRKTHTASINGVRVGSNAPVMVQSMTNTDTADIPGTIKQVAALARAGSEVVRVTVNNDDAAKAIPHIVEGLEKQGLRVPIVGDFHYNGHLLLTKYPGCAEGLAKYRINPGNASIGRKNDDNFRTMIAVSYTHLDVYKRQRRSILGSDCALRRGCSTEVAEPATDNPAAKPKPTPAKIKLPMAEIQRRKTFTATIGAVRVGSNAPIMVQSMTNTDTAVSYTHLDVYKRQIRRGSRSADARGGREIPALRSEGAECHDGCGDEMCIRDRSPAGKT